VGGTGQLVLHTSWPLSFGLTLWFAEAARSNPPGRFDDYARLMYSEYSRSNSHVWIIGPPLGSGPEPDRPSDILKIWPERTPIQRFTPAEFNPLLDRIVAAHCLDR
jgi:hypothetical protein